MRAVRDNGVTIFFLALTLVTLLGQALAGLALERQELLSHHVSRLPTLWEFVTSSSFGVDVLENWQSEFMQFATFILATVWLVQRGSAEAKAPEDAGMPTGATDASFWRRHGLLLVMVACFVLTWVGQSVTGWRVYNEEQALHGDVLESWAGYLATPEFWSRTLQNWQSEFLAVAAMSIFTVYLRERGSPESKRLDTPDHANEPTY